MPGVTLFSWVRRSAVGKEGEGLDRLAASRAETAPKNPGGPKRQYSDKELLAEALVYAGVAGSMPLTACRIPDCPRFLDSSATLPVRRTTARRDR